MQFGLFSNGERQNQVAKITYDEDLAEVILADELGLAGGVDQRARNLRQLPRA